MLRGVTVSYAASGIDFRRYRLALLAVGVQLKVRGVSMRDAARIICRRSRLPEADERQGRDGGRRAHLRSSDGGAGRLWRPAVGGREQQPAIDGAVRRSGGARRGHRQAGEAGNLLRRVKVDVAPHSPQMDPLRADLLEALDEVQPQTPVLPFYPDGDRHTRGRRASRCGVPGAQSERPVLFLTSVRQLDPGRLHHVHRDEPHPILVPAVQEILQHAKLAGLAIGSLRRGEDEQAEMLGSLGAGVRVRARRGLGASLSCRRPIAPAPVVSVAAGALSVRRRASRGSASPPFGID